MYDDKNSKMNIDIDIVIIVSQLKLSNMKVSNSYVNENGYYLINTF